MSTNQDNKIKYNIDCIKFENPFLNASGCWVINSQQINQLNESKLGGIISKTCSIFSKKGNNEPNYYHDESNNFHFNCKGLPNFGYNYYRNISDNISKPYFLSIAFDKKENMLAILKDYDWYNIKIDQSDNYHKKLIEINMSCPNVHNRIPGYHLEELQDFFSLLSENKFNNLIFGLKLPPYFELEFIYRLADLLNNYCNIIQFITMSNSIPNALPMINNEFILSNIYGGLSGKVNKYISLSNIYTIRRHLRSEIKIIGCGGIETLQDIQDYKKVGADFFQLGSCFYDEISNNLDVEKINELIDAFKNQK